MKDTENIYDWGRILVERRYRLIRHLLLMSLIGFLAFQNVYGSFHKEGFLYAYKIASVGNDIFTGSYEARNLNRENFILYLTSEAYCDFEAAVQEAMDDLNPEILDAVMDVTENTPDGDEITEKYWDTQRTLLKEFLEKLYDEVISTWR